MAQTWGDLIWVARIWADLTWGDLIWAGQIWVAPQNRFQCHILAHSRHKVGVQVPQCGTQALAAILQVILVAILVGILEVTLVVTLFTMGTFQWEVVHLILTRQCSPLP